MSLPPNFKVYSYKIDSSQKLVCLPWVCRKGVKLDGCKKSENLWSQITQEFLIPILRVANSDDDRNQTGNKRKRLGR